MTDALAQILGGLPGNVPAGPGIGGVAVTAHDSNDDTNGPFRYFWVGTGGTIKMTGLDGATFTLTNVPTGMLWVGGTRIWSSTTTASGIIGIK